MRIALAQTKPRVGCLESNVADHVRFVEVATTHGCDCVVFPELSLSGYEPSLANSVALPPNAVEIEPLRRLSTDSGCRVCIGMPLKDEALPKIAAVTIAPAVEPIVYCKRLLHPDELPYFAAGTATESWILESPRTAIVVCFELTDDALIETACQSSAELLIASVAKHEDGMASAHARLSELARRFKVPILIVNSLGVQDGMACSGGSAAWNRQGNLLSQLNGTDPGLLIVDFADDDLRTTTVRYLQTD